MEQRFVKAPSLDTICGALAYAMGIDSPECAAEGNTCLMEYTDKVFGGEKADRVVMYNPDAIARWIYGKYPQYLSNTKSHSDIEIPLSSVMPSVTFASRN